MPARLEASISQGAWLSACRGATEALREILAGLPTTRERAVGTGQGEGGDVTLVIDQAAEDAVFDQLEALHTAGMRFTAISEERGEVGFGDPAVKVVIDPIDGSLNAKRDLPHHALSIAVAAGDTMADVEFGYVYDFGPGEEWLAVRGEGAWLDGERLDTEPRERRVGGKLEVLGIEAADPRWVAEASGRLGEAAHRLRALGTIAVTLCQVAAARMDGMATLKGCRAVDAAAGQLIVREAGGHVSFPACDEPLSAPLDVVPRSPLVAARTAEAVAELTELFGLPSSGR